MRKLLLIISDALGLICLWQYLHSNEIVFLMIHGVIVSPDESKWRPLRSRLSQDMLGRILRSLSKKYKFISLDDAIDMITGNIPVRPYSVVLTFDDGYLNNFTHALPILKKYNAPATFYLVCGNTESNEPFWFDRLDYALQHLSSPSMKVKIGERIITIDNSSRENLINSFSNLRNTAKGIYQDDLEMLSEIDKLTLALENESGWSLLDIHADDNWSAIMNWQEAKYAIASGLITIGSHTVDHIRLSMVNKEMAKEQLERSKIIIEENTGVACKHFCYPNGDWNHEVAEITKQCGYQSAVTTDPGRNSVGDNQFCLRRINVPVAGSDIEIMASITGFWPAVMRLKGKVLKPFNTRSC